MAAVQERRCGCGEANRPVMVRIAQARRPGHHLANRLAEIYSNVAPEIEPELLNLERRW